MSHALEVLEFERVLGDIASRTVSPAGGARVRGLRPVADVERADRQLEAVEELVRGAAGGASPPGPRPFPSIDSSLARLAVEGGVLEAEPLLACAAVLRATREALGLGDRVQEDGAVAALLARLRAEPDLEKRIAGTFDDAGAVAEGASAELRRIRRSLNTRRSELVDRLERFAADLPDRVRVPDASVTVRNGRYCIPV
ncbi:MAG: hypothetical protein R3266_09570, partial [Gemmatimonadota bacterium]|nr:hypothetical protein [Gemmatimonadota bacterium]